VGVQPLEVEQAALSLLVGAHKQSCQVFFFLDEVSPDCYFGLGPPLVAEVGSNLRKSGFDCIGGKGDEDSVMLPSSLDLIEEVDNDQQGNAETEQDETLLKGHQRYSCKCTEDKDCQK
jgi:hypothetical protein